MCKYMKNFVASKKYKFCYACIAMIITTEIILSFMVYNI